jgi:hypothetical protein
VDKSVTTSEILGIRERKRIRRKSRDAHGKEMPGIFARYPKHKIIILDTSLSTRHKKNQDANSFVAKENLYGQHIRVTTKQKRKQVIEELSLFDLWNNRHAFLKAIK